MKIKHTNITDNDVLQVANLHLVNINQGFLSKLGSKFLYYLYKSISTSLDGFLIIATDNNDIVIGFVAGTTDLQKLYKQLVTKYFIQIVFCILPKILSFSTISRIWDIVIYSRRSVTENGLPKSELLSIAVDQHYRGKKAARLLFSELCSEFEKNHITQFKIVVGSDLKRAQAFYKKMGAVEISELELHSGSQSTLYIVNLQ